MMHRYDIRPDALLKTRQDAGARLVLNGNMKDAPPNPPWEPGENRLAAHFLAFATPTPLVELGDMADSLGLASLHVKDETTFAGLTSFKARGAAWAAARAASLHCGLSSPPESFEALRESMDKPMLFVTATDGNHGAALAWAARQLGCQAAVFLPAGARPERVRTIEALGARCVVTSSNYDDTVREAARFAAGRQGVLVQDTAWEGYVQIPAWIMAGYATLAREAVNQLAGSWPTHVFLQVGVGSFAAAMIAAFGELAKEVSLPLPAFICMEADAANWFYRSLQSGRKSAVAGDLSTVMDGLACGEASTLAWPLLRDYAFAAASCPDFLALRGMKLLAQPKGGDAPVMAGPSGAPGMGLLEHLCLADPSWRKRLGLNSAARVLLIATEGICSSK